MPLWNSRAEETLRFTPRYIEPTEIAHTLLDPDATKLVQDIKSFTVDFATKSVVVTGPADTLHSMERLLRVLDQKPREVRLEFRLEKDGKTLWQDELPNAKCNKQTVWRKGNFFLTLMPHVNGDGSLTLWLETNSQKKAARIRSKEPYSFSLEEGTLIVTSPSTKSLFDSL